METTEKNGAKFQIGDLAWRATWDCSESWVPCPDCGGERALTVVLYDGTEHSIDCAGCAAGYEPPRGRLRLLTYGPATHIHTVMGVELKRDAGFEYVLNTGHHVQEEDLFATKEEAEVRAEVLSREQAEKELLRVYRKDKNNHTWAWHVHYHRRQAKEAQRQVEYHTQKLAVAKVKAKTGEDEIGQSNGDKVSA